MGQTTSLFFGLVLFFGLLSSEVSAQGNDEAAETEAEKVASGEEGEVIYIRGDESGLEDLLGKNTEARERRRGLSDPHFVSVFQTDQVKAEAKDVPTVLSGITGVRTRSLGGLGSFSSVSIRGADSGHTQIFVDGVPLSRIASVTTDLSQFNINDFSNITVYRGGVPAALGSNTIGGAVLLNSSAGYRKHPVSISAGVGSFGAKDANLRYQSGTKNGRWKYIVSASGRKSDGDFSYFNDNGTPLSLSDDSYAIRENNFYQQYSGVARLGFENDKNVIKTGVRIAHRNQGITGSANQQTEEAFLKTLNGVADVQWRRRNLFGVDDLALDTKLFGFAETQTYGDPLGEVGLAVQNRKNKTASATAQFNLEFKKRLPLFGSVEIGGDKFSDSEKDSMRGSDGRRLRFGASASTRANLGALTIEPSLRLDSLQTRSSPPLESANPDDISVRQLLVSPRVTALWALTGNIALKSNAGRYFRVPTLLELFGDRGFVLGNPGLKAESGESIDLGAVWSPKKPIGSLDRIYVEGAGFFRQTRDTIVLAANAGLVARAENVGRTQGVGAEIGTSFRLAKTISATFNYTYLVATRRDGEEPFAGNVLPRRPRHDFYGRLDGAGRIFSRLVILWTDLSVLSKTYLDNANLREVPSRRLLGMGAKVELPMRIFLGLEVRNMADQRTEQENLFPSPRPSLSRVSRAISDIGGYPLPGRAFFLRMEWNP